MGRAGEDGRQGQGGVHPPAQDPACQARPRPAGRHLGDHGANRGDRPPGRAQTAARHRAFRCLRGEEPPHREEELRHLDDPPG